MSSPCDSFLPEGLLLPFSLRFSYLYSFFQFPGCSGLYIPDSSGSFSLTGMNISILFYVPLLSVHLLGKWSSPRFRNVSFLQCFWVTTSLHIQSTEYLDKYGMPVIEEYINASICSENFVSHPLIKEGKSELNLMRKYLGRGFHDLLPQSLHLRSSLPLISTLCSFMICGEDHKRLIISRRNS